MSRLSRGLSLGFLALTLCGLDVRAQTPPPSAETKKLAKQYVDAGLAAQNARDYDTAIELYAKANQLIPHPILIFNMAQAHRLAGRVDKAVPLYQSYLAADPGGSKAQTARDILADIQREADRKREEARQAEADRQAEAARIEAARRAEELRKADAAREARELEAARLAAPRAAPPSSSTHLVVSTDVQEPSPGRNLRIAGLSFGAAGAVSIGLAIGFGLRSMSLNDQVEEEYDPDKVAAGERADKIVIAGWIIGPALLATGTVLYWKGHQRRRDAQRLTIAPLLTPDLNGVVVSGFLP